MCGIFGFAALDGKRFERNLLEHDLGVLYRLSESRGVESAGISYDNGRTIRCLKKNVSASVLLKQPALRKLLDRSTNEGIYDAVIAHARMVTNGTSLDNRNNQPVVAQDIVLVHNGIITNESRLIRGHPDTKRFDVDTEWLNILLRESLEAGVSVADAIADLYGQIRGAASFACLFADRCQLLLSSNTGSLFYANDDTIVVFASERSILKSYLSSSRLAPQLAKADVVQVRPGEHRLHDLLPPAQPPAAVRTPKQIEDLTSYSDAPLPPPPVISNIDSLLQDNSSAIESLRRCQRCLLPQTFPFIKFDIEGVCSYCKHHPEPMKEPRTAEFEALLSRYRRDRGNDCVMAMSGGRDSSYGMHLLVKEFGMHPVTFTYDWGMVTDLARRNIANMCGELGIENILVSANIPRKRDYIRKNVSAWLRRPVLGLIPLFMAGDKFFFKYVNSVKQNTGLDLNVWSANQYENTDFKSGFAGVPPNFDGDRVDSISWIGKLQMPMYYAGEFMKNPRYVNSSLLDTIGAYWSYYFEPREDICYMFNYLLWDESEVEHVLIDEYDWEVSKETRSTWRIGDGTAAFYNYIYLTMAGFSEFDTFRSNQIRAGVLSREDGLSRITLENRPQIDGIRWYCDSVGLDLAETLKAINRAPKLYEQ